MSMLERLEQGKEENVILDESGKVIGLVGMMADSGVEIKVEEG